ncbi:MAG TPA: hypothetical protein EYH02_00070 [Ignisphaera aggregans]|uniref:Uncharacterized protein n=1 Tax=Ignisphaera aggregans TaxID=334771 RepID=A0A832YZ58_9CREN|nr:hypothetical protein [Ignisphaera aggregans]
MMTVALNNISKLFKSLNDIGISTLSIDYEYTLALMRIEVVCVVKYEAVECLLNEFRPINP